MTDQAELVSQLLTQVSNMQQQMASMQQQNPGGAFASPAPKPTGMSVPVKLEGPAGSIRYYLHLPAECAATLDTQIAAIEAIERSGIPLDTWSSRSNSGGYGRSNGDYRRGSYGYRR